MVSKKILAIVYVAFSSVTMMAQNDSTKKITSDKLNHFSYGVNFNQCGGDFGMGIDITSFYFDGGDNDDGDDFGAFRLTAGENFISGVLTGETNISAFGYSVIRLGIVDRKFIISKKIAVIYEEGGTLVLPSSKISSQSNRLGLYLLPSVEFYSSKCTSIIFQMGADVGQACIADKLVGEPNYFTTNSYANKYIGAGFLAAVLLRRYF
jgi:hypothetical protein